MNQQLLKKNLLYISKVCPLEKLQIFKNDLIIVVKSNLIIDILLFFKYHLLNQFELMGSVSGVDYPIKKYRFKVVYELLSIRYNFRIRVKTFAHELTGIESCNRLFLTGGWFECEIWDMFGLFFKNHPNLKRILTDYGFEGYPLRKDFPLTGFIEMRYNETQKRVISESIELSQEYRTFLYMSPWESQKL